MVAHLLAVDDTFDATGNVDVIRISLDASHKGWGGTVFGGVSDRTDLLKIVDWYLHGKFEMDPMITHKLKLEDINHGFELMHQGISIRAGIEF